jgi:hypothetical protein
MKAVLDEAAEALHLNDLSPVRGLTVDIVTLALLSVQ